MKPIIFLSFLLFLSIGSFAQENVEMELSKILNQRKLLNIIKCETSDSSILELQISNNELVIKIRNLNMDTMLIQYPCSEIQLTVEIIRDGKEQIVSSPQGCDYSDLTIIPIERGNGIETTIRLTEEMMKYPLRVGLRNGNRYIYSHWLNK